MGDEVPTDVKREFSVVTEGGSQSTLDIEFRRFDCSMICEFDDSTLLQLDGSADRRSSLTDRKSFPTVDLSSYINMHGTT